MAEFLLKKMEKCVCAQNQKTRRLKYATKAPSTGAT